MERNVLNLRVMIRIVWQPIADTSTRVLRGAEALARNVHDVEIPNINNPATALQCLAKAVDEAKRLNELGLFASVNIEPGMVHELEGLVLDPKRMFFEVTERGCITDPDKFRELQNRGYRFVVDDWPQGYSRDHLNVLTGAGLVKISQEYFLSSAPADLRLTIESMHRNDMQVVAEGVETDEHWKKATEVGADFVQGFHPSLGLPVPLSELEERFSPANLT
jgi:EAL domain-containing protein (putative c-di-GMP-specific phosphodiesterase class I)